MKALAVAAGRLRARGTPFALIGAAAMAAHGVSRATLDVDLLVTDRACLEPGYWQDLPVQVEIHPGDADDPLGGVVRLRAGGPSPLDVVVGRAPWQAEVLSRAAEVEIAGVGVPVAARADLILLKLYAGGPQDAWDILQLLAGPEGAATASEVEERLAALPEAARALWARLRPDPAGWA